ncbi:chorismate mutase [SAR202 cluster bacterium AD-804-J14_MRT_500m]|nr:chorismate mutase [SAR202 cluster bacterium AD-804-J14_MRT_500m]
MTQCWAIRGATTVLYNTTDQILVGTRELLEEMIQVNQIKKEQIVAAWFTTTQDLDAVFPARAARQMGWMNVALMCAHEMMVPNSLIRCIRVLLLVNTEKSPEELQYIYLRDAKDLRSQGLGD